jgi:mono/diheme cytochrome c family protein
VGCNCLQGVIARAQPPSQQGSASPDWKAAAVPESGQQQFQKFCARCHGRDGTGSPGRGTLAGIPDFTHVSWQDRRADAQLIASILDGKGKEMPSFSGKVEEDQARSLVRQIRHFASNRRAPGRAKEDRSSPGSFEEEFRRLQQELEELKRESGQVSKIRQEANAPDRPRPHHPRLARKNSNPHHVLPLELHMTLHPPSPHSRRGPVRALRMSFFSTAVGDVTGRTAVAMRRGAVSRTFPISPTLPGKSDTARRSWWRASSMARGRKCRPGARRSTGTKRAG